MNWMNERSNGKCFQGMYCQEPRDPWSTKYLNPIIWAVDARFFNVAWAEKIVWGGSQSDMRDLALLAHSAFLIFDCLKWHWVLNWYDSYRAVLFPIDLFPPSCTSNLRQFSLLNPFLCLRPWTSFNDQRLVIPFQVGILLLKSPVAKTSWGQILEELVCQADSMKSYWAAGDR